MTVAERVCGIAAAVVPVLVSLVLVWIVGALLPPAAAWGFFLGWVGVVVAAATAGQRWLPRLIWGCRRPTPAEQLTLSGPMWRAWQEEQLRVPGARVRVYPGYRWVRGYGARTLLVGEKVIAQLRSGQLSAEEGAALIAHQLGLLRAGAARREPLTHVLASPWHLIGATRIPVLTTLLRAGWALRGLYVPVLGYLAWAEQDPFCLVAIGLIVVSYLVPHLTAAWLRTRLRVADRALAGTSLGPVFAQWLLRVDPSPAQYDRVYAMATWGRPVPGQVLAQQTPATWW